MASDPLSLEEKQQALERVLTSRTFSRSDQLRSFLRYVCEAEFEGRAQEINEYALGVSVLGRRPGYSPTEDSCVRSRAYELRSKLKSYYQSEAPHDPIQIEVHKGAYVPCFQRRSELASAKSLRDADGTQPGVAGPTQIPHRALVSGGQVYLLLLSMAVLLIALLVAPVSDYLSPSARERIVAKGNSRPSLAPEMAALWKPFLDSDAPLLISFEIRLFFYSPSSGLVVRDFRTNELADLPKSKPLNAFQAGMGTYNLKETLDYADFGAVHAVFLLGRLMTAQGRETGLKHSGSLGWEDIRNSNVIFIGKPNLNPTIQYVLKDANFVDDEFGVIHNLHPLPGESPEYRSAATHGSGEKYALITWLPGPKPGHHILILDGAGSEVMWALGECVTDPAYVKQIVSHLRLPSGECPESFQVVIQATFESNVPVKIRYVTHRVSTIR